MATPDGERGEKKRKDDEVVSVPYLQGDGVADELGVLLDDFLDPLLLEVLRLVLLHVQNDDCATADGLGFIMTHCERPASSRLP